jgi:hypothetical protein
MVSGAKEPATRRRQLRVGNAFAGDENLLAFKDVIQELGKLGFGFVNVVGRHSFSLVHFED